MYVDGDLYLETHISHLSRTYFYHLRQLRVVRRSLTTDATHSLITVIRALVPSQVDYCNGVLAGLPLTQQINRLQSLLRAAARLVLQLPGWASFSNPMRVQLHWLSILQRIQFNLRSVVSWWSVVVRTSSDHHSIGKDYEYRQTWIFGCRSCCLEQSIHHYYL